MTENKALIYKKVPTAYPVPGEHLVVEIAPLDPSSSPPTNGLLVESLYTSFDPYLRGRMRSPKIASYNTPLGINTPIVNFSIIEVIKSSNDNYKEGDLLIGRLQI